MPAPVLFAAVVLGLVLVRSPMADASEASAVTDANLVTALDVSDSIMRHEEWIEFDGIARAVVHPDFLSAVRAGRHGRVGFAVYTWASGGNFRVIVPWMVIASIADAERVAAVLRSAPPIDRSRYGGHRRHESGRQAPADLRTDVSAAVLFGLGLMNTAPRPTEREVINIHGNGVDNTGAGPQAARDLALALGVTINGLVVGDRAAVAAYFRSHVAGGAGSFVLQVTDPVDVADALVRKFLMDLIAGPGGGVPWT